MMPHRSERPAWAVLLLALLPAAWTFWTQRDVPHFGFLLDDAIYHVSAKSLAEGAGYRIESLPGAPAQTKYPPGFAALLAAVWRLHPGFPENLTAALLLNAAAFFAFSLVLLPPLFRDLGIPPPWHLLLAAAAALNPPSIFYAASLMSETLAAVVFAGVLLAVPRSAWAAGLLTGVSILMRSASVVLLAAGAGWLLIRRRWRQTGIYLALSLPALIAWTLWSRAHRAAGGTPQFRYYVDYFGYLAASVHPGDLWEVIGANFGTLMTHTGSVLWFEPGDSLAATYGKTVLTLLTAAGLVRLVRENGLSVYVIFAAGYLAILLPWNFSPNERFLLPLLPLLLAGAFHSARSIAGAMTALWRKSGAANRIFAGFVLSGLAIGGLCWMRAQLDATFSYFPALFERERARRAEEAPALAWVRAHLPADAVAIAYQESRFYLFSGRRAIGMPLPSRIGYGGDRKAIRAYFDDAATAARANGARFLYVTPWDFELDLDGKERAERASALGRDPAWREIYSAGGFGVWELTEHNPRKAESDAAPRR